jgi:hypothetical protein
MPKRPVTLTAFAQPSWLRLELSLLSSPPHATTMPQPPCRLPALPRGLASKMQLTRTVMCMHGALMCNACSARMAWCADVQCMHAAHAWMHGASWQKRNRREPHRDTTGKRCRDELTLCQCASGRKGLRRSNAAQQYGCQRQHAPGEAHARNLQHRRAPHAIRQSRRRSAVHHRLAQRTHRARGPARRCWSGGERRRSAALQRTTWLRTGRRSRPARPAPPACPSRCPAPLPIPRRPARVVAVNGLQIG